MRPWLAHLREGSRGRACVGNFLHFYNFLLGAIEFQTLWLESFKVVKVKLQTQSGLYGNQEINTGLFRIINNNAGRQLGKLLLISKGAPIDKPL